MVSTIGIYFVKAKPGLPHLKEDYGELEDALDILKRGYYVSLFLAIIGLWFICDNFLNIPRFPNASVMFFCCACVGVCVSFLFIMIT